MPHQFLRTFIDLPFFTSQGLEGPINDSTKSTRTVLREMAFNMKDKSVSYGKAFAMFGALYAFNECVIEKFRAKHDKVNPALAGCATGAMLAYSGEVMCRITQRNV